MRGVVRQKLKERERGNTVCTGSNSRISTERRRCKEKRVEKREKEKETKRE